MLTLGLCGSVYAQSRPGTVYVLSAFPATKVDAKVQASLYTVDGTSGTIRRVQSIADPDGGVDGVSFSYGARVLVVTAPALTPTNAYIVSMDAPGSSAAKSIGFSQGLSVLSQHILRPSDGSTMLAMVMADEESPYLFGANLTALGNNPPEFQKMPWASFSGVQVFGSIGVGEVWSDVVQVHIRADGTIRPAIGAAQIDPLDFVAPADLRVQNGALTFLNANNEDIALLSSASRMVRSPAGLGNRTDYVYNKNTGVWKQLIVPGSVSWARASGPWLLYVVAEPSKTQNSPGREERAALAKDEPVGDLISGAGVYLPGKLLAYDSRSGQSYTLDTGQGDTEPLLLEGRTLYYRVNDSIYTATIGAGSTQNPTRVATDPALLQVHWAFVGW